MGHFSRALKLEFRVAARWLPVAYTSVRATSVVDVDSRFADVLVDSLPSGNYAGGTLSIGGTDFPLESFSTVTNVTVRVRKVGSKLPTIPAAEGANALIISAGTPTALTRVKKTARLPSRPASVTQVEVGDDFPLLQADFPRVLVAPVSGAQITAATYPYRVYLHLFRATFTARLVATNKFQLERPDDLSAGAFSLFNQWKALAPADAQAALLNSPCVVYPQHMTTVSVPPPSSFQAGLLELQVTASDNKSYVSSPALPATDASLLNLKGNEGDAATVNVSFRNIAQPATLGLALYGSGPDQPWNQGERVWARSAADYAEAAQFQVKWQPAGAVRYEVWRVLQEGLPGASLTTTDADLRLLASANPDAFQLRSDREFGTGYLDDIPGRAPTRALYKLRGVSAAGVFGPFSDIIGPVHVPDVRRPTTPNILRVAALRHDPSAMPPVPDKAILLEWTLPGDVSDTRFDIYFRVWGSASEHALAGTVPRGTAPDGAKRYRFTHLNRDRGVTYEYVIVAIREALDPDDVTATARRTIAGAPSAAAKAIAISALPLPAPAAVTAQFDPADGEVILAWTNGAAYSRIVVRRRSAIGFGYITVGEISGTETEYRDYPGTGAWYYQVQAFDAAGEARSVDAQVTVT